VIPFDRISPALMRRMRIATGLSFAGLGVGMVLAAVPGLRAPLAPAGPLAWLPAAAALHGVLLVNAGAMLLELVTRPPLRLALNLPFVAGSFQNALAVGLAVVGLLGWAGATAPTPLAATAAVGFAMNLLFVGMTKLHWNFEANRAHPGGDPGPKAAPGT